MTRLRCLIPAVFLVRVEQARLLILIVFVPSSAPLLLGLRAGEGLLFIALVSAPPVRMLRTTHIVRYKCGLVGIVCRLELIGKEALRLLIKRKMPG